MRICLSALRRLTNRALYPFHARSCVECGRRDHWWTPSKARRAGAFSVWCDGCYDRRIALGLPLSHPISEPVVPLGAVDAARMEMPAFIPPGNAEVGGQ